jgi:hypothetical protein
MAAADPVVLQVSLRLYPPRSQQAGYLPLADNNTQNRHESQLVTRLTY